MSRSGDSDRAKDHDPRGTMTDEEWDYWRSRHSPDFPTHFGPPIGDTARDSDLREAWVRSSVETHTRAGREARLRALEGRVTVRDRLAELDAKVRRFR